ncbi:MAG: hypothetical protein IKU71_08975 [Kiritimatiellae bacterium]|nr:hypothetical protein [Kiritimatiellia bacterium]
MSKSLTFRKIAFVLPIVAMGLTATADGCVNVAPRTGRLFQSSRYPHYSFLRGAEAFGAGVMTLNPFYIAALPFIIVGDLACSPIYDILCIPRDLYIRSRLGVTLEVCELDGSPIAGVKCQVMMPSTKDNSPLTPLPEYVTGEDGKVEIPFFRNVISIHGINQSLDALGYDVYPYDAYLFPLNENGVAELKVNALKRGRSYPLITNSLDVVVNLDSEGCFLQDIDLMTARTNHVDSLGFRIKRSHSGEVSMMILPGIEERMLRIPISELEDADLPSQLSLVPYENREMAGKHLERGLPVEEVIAFRTHCKRPYYGVIVSFSAETNLDTKATIIHMEWIFNVQNGWPNLRQQRKEL